MSSSSSPVGYTAPSIPLLLTVTSFIFLLNVGEYLFSKPSVINAGLIGSLIVGVIYGSEASNILPDYVQSTFTILGYIGLILIVFEAGISTNMALLYSNLVLSSIVALSGVGLPILASILLLSYGYGFSLVQSFASGVALCSTSVGTTLALLRPELRQTKSGTILLSAALLDDITSLVFAGIIPNLPHAHDGLHSSNSIKWFTIARPILTSFAFGIGTPLGAILMKKLISALPDPMRHRLYIGEIQLCAIVIVLSGFVAAAQYAGTSELFGAYLAGASLQHLFGKAPNHASHGQPATSSDVKLYTPISAFSTYILPLLQHFLSPMFFASIGMAIPIRSLFLVNGSRRVIWRGILYSLLMMIAKALVGLWMLVWADVSSGYGWCGLGRKEAYTRQPQRSRQPPSSHVSDDEDKVVSLTRAQSAALVGLAMIARGEIALIVAQLARPLLVDRDDSSGVQDTSELFAIVIWAILLTTIGGALGVGLLLHRLRA